MKDAAVTYLERSVRELTQRIVVLTDRVATLERVVGMPALDVSDHERARADIDRIWRKLEGISGQGVK